MQFTSIEFNLKVSGIRSGMIWKELTGSFPSFVYLFFGATAPPPQGGYGLLIHEVSRAHTTTHRTR